MESRQFVAATLLFVAGCQGPSARDDENPLPEGPDASTTVLTKPDGAGLDTSPDAHGETFLDSAFGVPGDGGCARRRCTCDVWSKQAAETICNASPQPCIVCPQRVDDRGEVLVWQSIHDVSGACAYCTPPQMTKSDAGSAAIDAAPGD